MKYNFFRKKWVVVTLHAICWTVLFSLPFFLRATYKKEKHPPQPDDAAMFYFYLVSSSIWVALFYLNAYMFLPLLLRTKKVWQFISLHILALAAVYFLHSLYFSLFVKHMPFKAENFFIYNIFTYLFIVASSTAYFFLLERQQSIILSQARETENLKTELLFLRSQVSPHFMFNVLNNMVALARKKSDLLEPSLIKLSSLMRYMLYETDEQKVPLEKEVEYIQSYINLQQQRFGKNVQVYSSFGSIDNGNEIEPMLLIPFVENAFKHGTGIIEDAIIKIELKVEKGMLQFIVSNKYNDTLNNIKDKDSGIGLNNVRRRLNLLYGSNHALLINKKDSWFTVSLQINLH
ncbi:sensor histidine kinase [Parafilimonas sp.]|uniref:sensor histidine kinase n=1 Tax=Parafilimonas sp. TaxID=1969739 RepID=UPI0039E71902